MRQTSLTPSLEAMPGKLQVSSAGLALPLSIAIVGVALVFTAVSVYIFKRRRAKAGLPKRPKEIEIPEFDASGSSGPESNESKNISSLHSSQTKATSPVSHVASNLSI